MSGVAHGRAASIQQSPLDVTIHDLGLGCTKGAYHCFALARHACISSRAIHLALKRTSAHSPRSSLCFGCLAHECIDGMTYDVDTRQTHPKIRYRRPGLERIRSVDKQQISTQLTIDLHCFARANSIAMPSDERIMSCTGHCFDAVQVLPNSETLSASAAPISRSSPSSMSTRRYDGGRQE